MREVTMRRLGRRFRELMEKPDHCSVVVTERYARLRPDLFAPSAHPAFALSLSVSGGYVQRSPRNTENGQPAARRPGRRRSTNENS